MASTGGDAGTAALSPSRDASEEQGGKGVAATVADDVTGAEAATGGACHRCGGSLSRGGGSHQLARLCGRCGTRFHTSDCGGRLAASGYEGPFDCCPKVRACNFYLDQNDATMH